MKEIIFYPSKMPYVLAKHPSRGWTRAQVFIKKLKSGARLPNKIIFEGGEEEKFSPFQYQTRPLPKMPEKGTQKYKVLMILSRYWTQPLSSNEVKKAAGCSSGGSRIIRDLVKSGWLIKEIKTEPKRNSGACAGFQNFQNQYSLNEVDQKFFRENSRQCFINFL